GGRTWTRRRPSWPSTSANWTSSRATAACSGGSGRAGTSGRSARRWSDMFVIELTDRGSRFDPHLKLRVAALAEELGFRFGLCARLREADPHDEDAVRERKLARIARAKGR